MKFPIYIKYPNNQTYIMILSKAELEEIRYMGKQKTISIFKAKTFPDKLYIQDLLQYVEEGKLIQIEAEEYKKEKGLL